MKDLAVIVLAAGKGTRMPSDVPKVLQPVGGEPLLAHILRTVRSLDPARIVLVLGHRAAEVRQAVTGPDLEIVLQGEQRGTGHAVMQAAPLLDGFRGTVLIVYGDVPLLGRETLLELRELHELERNAASVLSATVPQPEGYGRIVRNAQGRCVGIVEQRNLSGDQEGIAEINSGIIAFEATPLFETLREVGPNAVAGEYYLTDVIAIFCRAGRRVGTYHLKDPAEILGVNTLEQLHDVERVHTCRTHSRAGRCELCEAAAAPCAEAAVRGPHAATLLLGGGRWICLKVASKPFNNGHLLVFPKRHVTCFPSLEREELAELSAWLMRAEGLLQRAYSMDALNMGINSGAGGHLTFHLIPRWRGDLNYLPLLAGLKLVPESPHGTWVRLCGVME
ncbi:MAG: NTP transferase domain-containing protein [Candidatus Eisenbacteria bacterium]